MVAPDDTTYAYLNDRQYAPKAALWDQALAGWRTLPTDDGATFERDIAIDCAGLAPQITWGTDPAQVIDVNGRVPDPAGLDSAKRAQIEKSLAYMGLTPGEAIEGLPVHRVFIGSCTNARLPDLETAANLVRGRRIAAGVQALVVPGSRKVKQDAEAKGLDRIFRDAGFTWGESACSMCAGANGDRGEPGERVLSTTNRNFENRQGPGVRTHLVGPALAAAAAVTGRITDVRKFMAGEA